MVAYELDRRLSELKVRELPINRRIQLSSYLNNEQVLMSDCGLARDYRGLAQQLDLTYSEIVQLEKLIDPCGTLLSYQKVFNLTVLDLFDLLVKIGRFDVLDDMIPLVLSDLTQLSTKEKQLAKNSLTWYGVNDDSKIWYDAYVCYADSDLEFVRRLADFLESPSVGFRLFIRDRDLLGGNWVYESFAHLIESQCRRMIIVLSPEFLSCPDCKFQSQFAAGLAIEKCQRILVPIIYRPCALPSILRLLSKIDMSAMAAEKDSIIPKWSLNRLVMSIGSQNSNDQTEQLKIEKKSSNAQENKLLNQSPIQQIESDSLVNDVDSTSNSIISVISKNDEISSSEIKNDEIEPLILFPASPNSSSTSTNLKDRNSKRNWIKSFKRKIKTVI